MFKLILILVFIISCKSEFTKDECDDLSMRKFIGIPSSANSFDKNCKNVKITYTKELCKKAFDKLVLGANSQTLKDQFGEKILNCFTKSDLNSFLKK